MKVLSVLLFLVLCACAFSHDPLVSSVQVRHRGSTTEILALAFADKLSERDPANDLRGRLHLEADGVTVDTKTASVVVANEQSSPAYRLEFTLPRRVERVDLTSRLFPELPGSATVFAGFEEENVLAIKTLTEKYPSSSISLVQGFRVDAAMLRHGIMHILSGTDHLVFLLGLLLLSQKIVPLLKILTAFTLAHSISLSLIALDVIRISPRIVEPLIALSIVAVATLSLLGKTFKYGLWIAIVFGLVHGCGFGSGLADLGFTRSNAVLSLLTFNIGVEIGQILAVMIAFPILSWINEKSEPGFVWTSRVLSSGTILLGVFWTVQRIFAP